MIILKIMSKENLFYIFNPHIKSPQSINVINIYIKYSYNILKYFNIYGFLMFID